MHWLQARADRLRLPVPQGSATSESYRRTLARRLAKVASQSTTAAPAVAPIEVLDSFAAETRILVTGTPQANQFPPSAERAELCLVREADGSRTLGMLLRLDAAHLSEAALPTRRYHCRLFLFEPEFIRRLEGLLGGRSYLDSFELDVFTNNPDVVRILAAVSELEGEWLAGQAEVRFPRLAVPDIYVLFPTRAEPLQIVAALHPAEESSSPA
jgi:hypothetical protein